jgi:exodeoxyribonuclease V alpha subunit
MSAPGKPTTSKPGPVLSPLGTARQRLEAPAHPNDAAAAELDPEDAFLAYEVASWARALPPPERAAFERIVARLLLEIGQGSTRLAVNAAERALLERVPTLVGPPGAMRPLVLAGEFLSTHRLHAAEARLSAAFAVRLHGAGAAPLFAEDVVTRALADAVATAAPAARPSDEQQAAVKRALAGRLGVITGGPGTGKTTIVLLLVRTLVRLGVAPEAIALAAPTGKAANRLGEALRDGLARLAGAPADLPLATTPPAAETLHRLLRHSPSARAFAHGESAPLPHAAVIVDESSMIDLGLMDRLVAAAAPGTLLVLLGDADQLPSVEAGTVFRDLAPLGVALVQSHRLDPSRPEGRRILALAAAVRQGTLDAADAGDAALFDRRATAAEVTFTGAELVPAPARDAFLTRWFTQRLDVPVLRQLQRESFALGDDSGDGADFAPEATALFDEAFAHHQRHRLLGVTRGRATGVDAVNAFMHARLGARTTTPIPGEPVMMLRNDYDRGLWNGDQGLVIRVREAGRARAQLDGGIAMAIFRIAGRWTPFPLESLRDSLSLAFALTVHKAQGSEFDEVAVVLPDGHTPVFSRDLLYTALTRCRRSVVLVGDPAVLAGGVSNAQLRSSGLARALRG